jgi:hypothetical protein
VYDSDQVATGEPVFRKLADAALVHFDYQFMAGRPATITGTHRLVAIVGNADGWKRTVELTPRTVFAGPAFEVEGRLNFDEIQSLIDTAETETGMLNEQYFLTVQPEVEAMGTLAGVDVRETFAPRLEFRFDDLQLQLARDGGTEESPLQETKKGMIERQQPAPNTISLLMLDLSVARARWLGLSGLLAAIAGLAVCGMLALREHRSPEPERIAARYRTQLVAIAQGDGVPTEWTVVEVARFESLLKIAGAKTRMILDEDLGTMHRYYVHDDGMTYRYSTVAPAGRLAAEPAEVA